MTMLFFKSVRWNDIKRTNLAISVSDLFDNNWQAENNRSVNPAFCKTNASCFLYF